jgi:hypothetical protein
MGYTQVGDLEAMFTVEPWERCAERIVRRCGDRLLELAEAYTPIAVVDPEEQFARRRLPGTLKRAWRSGEVQLFGTGHLEVIVENNDPIARYVEYPTKPHTIRPKADRQAASVIETRKPRGTVQDGRAHLRFKVGGRVVYAREVHHPGTHGAHMLSRALAALAVEWREIAEDEIARTAREVGSL